MGSNPAPELNYQLWVSKRSPQLSPLIRTAQLTLPRLLYSPRLPLQLTLLLSAAFSEDSEHKQGVLILPEGGTLGASIQVKTLYRGVKELILWQKYLSFGILGECVVVRLNHYHVAALLIYNKLAWDNVVFKTKH